MSGLRDEINYFVTQAKAVPPVQPGRFVPFQITLRLGAPINVTTPWIHLDGLVGHLLLLDTLGKDFFITPKKLNLVPYLPTDRRTLPLKRTGAIYHASASMFDYYSVRVAQIYKRFEDKWTDSLHKRKINVVAGHFKAHMMKTPYIPCREVTFYAVGDLDIVQRLLEKYLCGLGDNCRVGFGVVRDMIFEPIDEDRSIVADGVAMRAIPVEMCEEYEDATYLAYRAPYWSPRNVSLCVPPGAKCKLKSELERSFPPVGKD